MDPAIPTIEPIRVDEHVTWFYWGRHPDHPNLDMQLGGGAHAIHSGEHALLVDTMNLPGQGAWVRRHLEQELGVRTLRVVNTHWHPDHVGDNHVFADCGIIAHAETRRLMRENEAGLARGLWPGCPPLRVELPARTFTGRLDLDVGGVAVQLLEFGIHERGHIGVWLPDSRTLIAGDMVEDPIWIFHFDFAGPDAQLAEYERMKGMGVERVLPTHGSPSIVRRGGYDASLIDHNAAYLREMLADGGLHAGEPRSAESYVAQAVARGELEWWPPYEVVHAENLKTISQLGGAGPSA